MEFLQQLQLQNKNEGSSTGTQWLISKGQEIVSFSPVDNNEIGKVISTDKATYEKLITVAKTIARFHWPSQACIQCHLILIPWP